MNNTRAQKWLIMACYRVGASTTSTLRGAKHFNSTSTRTVFTNSHTWIQQWERNKDILTTDFEVNS